MEYIEEADYDSLIIPYQDAMANLMTRLDSLNNDYRRKYKNYPIHHMQERIKKVPFRNCVPTLHQCININCMNSINSIPNIFRKCPPLDASFFCGTERLVFSCAYKYFYVSVSRGCGFKVMSTSINQRL